MSWLDYYELLVIYKGDLSKATESEMRRAARGNPNNPIDARRIAEEKYKINYSKEQTK